MPSPCHCPLVQSEHLVLVGAGDAGSQKLKSCAPALTHCEPVQHSSCARNLALPAHWWYAATHESVVLVVDVVVDVDVLVDLGVCLHWLYSLLA